MFTLIGPSADSTIFFTRLSGLVAGSPVRGVPGLARITPQTPNLALDVGYPVSHVRAR